MAAKKRVVSTEPDVVGDIGYADALEELERILDELESDDVDVDELSAKVRRAAALLEACRVRIRDAKMRIEEVVDSLDDK